MARGFLDEDAPRDGDDNTDDARTVEITGRITARTSKALQFDSGDRMLHWVPLSQIRGSRQSRPDVIVLRLPEWWAKKEGMI